MPPLSALAACPAGILLARHSARVSRCVLPGLCRVCCPSRDSGFSTRQRGRRSLALAGAKRCRTTDLCRVPVTPSSDELGRCRTLWYSFPPRLPRWDLGHAHVSSSGSCENAPREGWRLPLPSRQPWSSLPVCATARRSTCAATETGRAIRNKKAEASGDASPTSVIRLI